MEKKKILLLVPMLHQGGFERVCVTTARLLEPYYDVTIALFNDANIAYDVTGLKLVNLNLGVQKGKIRKLFNVFRRVKKIKELKKNLQPQLTYSFGPTANLVNALAPVAKTQIWLGLRNYTDLLSKFKMKLFIRHADLIICCSKQIEAELQAKFHFTKTATVYNPYDVEAIKKTAAAHEPELPFDDEVTWLLSMGRDDEMKGFSHMMKAFKCVYEKHPECRLMILGAGTYEKYRKLATELGISDAVFFAGMQKEPYGYLKKGSVYLLTSQNEGFPNALVEGMCLGLAAVSVDCKTGPAEILLEKYETDIQEIRYGEYGILLPEMEFTPNYDATAISQEEENMASVIIDLLENKEKLSLYQEKAAERAQIFTYETYTKKLLNLCNVEIAAE